jgi:hypothetical protein
VTAVLNGRVLRQSKGFDIKLGGICDDCNSGWMNDLEKAFRSLVFPAISSEDRLPLRLDGEQQRTVATWGVKTWMLAERALQHDRGLAIRSEDTLRYLCAEHKPPPAIQVMVGVTPSPQDSLTSMWTLVVPSPPEKPAGAVAFMTIGQLMFCFFAPLMVGDVPGEGRLDLSSDLLPALQQIWPHQMAEVAWPTPSVLSTEEFSEVLQNTNHNLLVGALDGPRRRLDLARDALFELIEEAKSYLAEPAFRFRFRHNEGAVTLLVDVLRPAPQEFPILFSEGVRNLVDALDDLARQLSLLSGGNPTRTGWPICETEEEWTNLDLGGADEALRSRIEKWQPFRNPRQLRWMVYVRNQNDASRRVGLPRVSAQPNPDALWPHLFEIEPGPGMANLYDDPVVARLTRKVPVGPMPPNPTIPVGLSFGDDDWKGTPWDLLRAADDISGIVASFADVF